MFKGAWGCGRFGEDGFHAAAVVGQKQQVDRRILDGCFQHGGDGVGGCAKRERDLGCSFLIQVALSGFVVSNDVGVEGADEAFQGKLLGFVCGFGGDVGEGGNGRFPRCVQKQGEEEEKNGRWE